MALSSQDLVILALVLAATAYYFASKRSAGAPVALNGSADSKALENDDEGEDAGRDFVQAMKNAKKKIVIFYGSQTGTAEDYATRIAKEAKQRYGLSSLVCDLEEYDFETLDQVAEDALVVFCMATYGEGEPTDNAVGFMEFLGSDDIAFSNGSSLDNLKYVVFGLGNSTYEHFCAIGRKVDETLSKMGAQRVGERGEGDDDKSMEEDYLAWKDGMWEAVQQAMGWDEGAGGDMADFEVREIDDGDVDDAKIYRGELSQRALTGSRGIFDAKNPYAAPLIASKELFEDGDRNCVFAEFDIKDTGIRYQTGDHVGVWPLNPDAEVERFLRVIGIADKRDQVIDVKSLDPALAKVPFPVPTTYDTVLRHYLDISQHASRQTVGSFAKFAPTDEARKMCERLGADKDYFHEQVGVHCLKLAEVLLMAAGDDLHADPHTASYTVWAIPFDRIISGIPRLQPRYYSISSSPKLHPDSVHVTAVVLKYKPHSSSKKHVYGVGTNYLLNLKDASAKEGVGANERGTDGTVIDHTPIYKLEGPRGKYRKDGGLLAAPIHIRRSTFRLPTSPKIPVVMIGPGTGVAPFRGFIQERVALARKAKDKDGPDALKEWGTIDLFYGCRRAEWDFLYRDEWESYAQELDGKFRLHVAFSREPNKPKTYVQQLIKEQEPALAEALVAKKGYCYICGDAKHMAREVEGLLEDILGRAKGGSHEDGVKELKLMKDRNRLLLDVWS